MSFEKAIKVARWAIFSAGRAAANPDGEAVGRRMTVDQVVRQWRERGKHAAESLAWLQDNRALIEGAPGLKAENEQLRKKYDNTIDRLCQSNTAAENLQIRAENTEAKLREAKQRADKYKAERDELLVSMEWMKEAMSKSAGDAWCAIRDQPNAKENMNRFDAAIAKAKTHQDATPRPAGIEPALRELVTQQKAILECESQTSENDIRTFFVTRIENILKPEGAKQ